ncbi:DMT family transporter [Clostridium sp.]|uniref:DMT family transporter n=1 Tax=Clostridium sp. TaxID=1506 RepID=UPI003217CD09
MNKYRNLAILNGILLAIMIFLNGVLSEKIGLYLSTLIYQVLGLLLILLVSIVRKNKLPNRKSSRMCTIFNRHYT